MKSGRLNWVWLSAALCIAISFALNWSVISAGFIHDDGCFFNLKCEDFMSAMRIKDHSAETILNFFNPLRGWYFRPVFLLYHVAGQEMWGANPLPFHIVSLVLHGLTAFSVAYLSYRLTRSLWSCLFAATIFLLWPQKDITLLWVAATSTLMAALFSLLAAHCWLSHRDKTDSRYFYAALVLWVLALLSKSDAIFAIALFVGIDIIRKEWRIRSYIVVVAMASVYLPLEYIASRSFKAAWESVPNARLAFPGSEALSLAERGVIVAKYFGLLFMESPPLIAVIFVLVAVAILSESRLRSGALVFALSSLALGLGFALMGRDSVSPRFLYLPVIGLCLSLSVSITAANPKAAVELYGSLATFALSLVLNDIWVAPALWILPYMIAVFVGILTAGLLCWRGLSHSCAELAPLALAAIMGTAMAPVANRSIVACASLVIVSLIILWREAEINIVAPRLSLFPRQFATPQSHDVDSSVEVSGRAR